MFLMPDLKPKKVKAPRWGRAGRPSTLHRPFAEGLQYKDARSPECSRCRGPPKVG